MSDEQEDFDVDEVYTKEIAPRVLEIFALCEQHKIPMLMTFALKKDDTGTDFCTTYRVFEDRSPMELVEAKSALFKRASPEVIMMLMRMAAEESKKS